VHRFHYASWGKPQEPWEHGAEALSRKYITLRQRLNPYFYSCTADSIMGTGLESGPEGGGTGLPLMRAMALEYPGDEKTYNMDTQFMSGPSFLVAPVTTNETKKSIYFPKGDWYDYSDGKTVYRGQQTVEYKAPLEKLPVFVKAGSIIPMIPEMQYLGQKKLDLITLDIYPLTSNGKFSFVLYEDDGSSFEYQDGKYCTTRYECTVNKNTASSKQTSTFRMFARKQGAAGFKPDSRDYWLQFHKAGLKIVFVKKDGTKLTQYYSKADLEKQKSGWFLDTSTEICHVKLEDTAKDITIELSGTYAEGK